MPAGRKSSAIPAEDPDREERIAMEIIVDCYNDSETAAGWSCHLEERLACPFEAECMEKTPDSPLKPGDRVTVLKILDLEESDGNFLGQIEWKDGEMEVPLSQLQAVNASPEATQALADWRYWVLRGYQF